MTDTTDVLEKYRETIFYAETDPYAEVDFCVAELAAEVRRLHARVAELETRLKARNDAETAYHAMTGQ